MEVEVERHGSRMRNGINDIISDDGRVGREAILYLATGGRSRIAWQQPDGVCLSDEDVIIRLHVSDSDLE